MKRLLSTHFSIVYILLILSLFFYSFTQIDLGLALTRFPTLFIIQRAFQQVGYFNRPLSTYLYFGIITSLFVSYCYALYAVRQGTFTKKALWRVILITSGILVFSYNAFSYDIFNYIFDAKIVTFYGKNPYMFKALDFPGDPMLAFMHWTHRVYPYGPVWLAISIPLSFIGMHVFLFTFFLFKLLAGVSYLGTAYAIEKVVQKIFPGQEAFSVAFFALNPLVIIESLVSGHNDIVMMFLAMISLYMLIQKKYMRSLVMFALSVGVKYATVFFFPIFLAIVVMQVLKEKVPWVSFLLTGIICLCLAIVAASQQSGSFQPWYFLFILPFASLLAHKVYVSLPIHIVSIMGLLVYVPFLYLGNWDKPAAIVLGQLYVGSIPSILITVLALVLSYGKQAKGVIAVKGIHKK